MTLAILAHAFLVVAALLQRIRHPPPPELIPLTCNEVSHLFVRPAARPLGHLAHPLDARRRGELEFAVAHAGEERMPLAWVEYERGSLPGFGVADAHAAADVGDLDAAAAVALRTRSASP